MILSVKSIWKETSDSLILKFEIKKNYFALTSLGFKHGLLKLRVNQNASDWVNNWKLALSIQVNKLRKNGVSLQVNLQICNIHFPEWPKNFMNCMKLH